MKVSKLQKLEIFPHVFGWYIPIETIVAVRYFEVLMLVCFRLLFPGKEQNKLLANYLITFQSLIEL